MGAKTALLAYTDDAVANVLRDVSSGDFDRAVDLVARVRPAQRISADGEEPWELAEALYPSKGTVCALSVPGLDLVCDQEIMIDRPSQLPGHLVAASRGRRLYVHVMHSAVDWLAFAVWDDGLLVRSLSLSPDSGIIEDIGERLPFEFPYWGGAYPVADYSLPFHPLRLGERAMLEFFGFCAEGCFDAGDAAEVVDPWGVELQGFRVMSPPRGE